MCLSAAVRLVECGAAWARWWQHNLRFALSIFSSIDAKKVPPAAARSHSSSLLAATVGRHLGCILVCSGPLVILGTAGPVSDPMPHHSAAQAGAPSRPTRRLGLPPVLLAIVWLALGRADARLLRLLARDKVLDSAPETQDHVPRCWRATQPARGCWRWAHQDDVYSRSKIQQTQPRMLVTI